MQESSKNEKETLIDIDNDLQNLLASQKTLMLATVSPDGMPDISYAPFIRDQAGHFFIFVSELASHTVNLLNKSSASIMLIRPESESGNLFARERAVFNCSVKEIVPDDESYNQHLDALQAHFGQVVTLIRSLSDFHLFELCPEHGRYIAGFGRAFRINSSDGSLHSMGHKAIEN